MNDIPPLAWAAIIAIGVITVLVNLAMVLLLRDPSQMRNIKMPRNDLPKIDMLKTVETLRDPFRDERKQLNELSHLVQQLDSPSNKTGEPEPPTTPPADKTE